MTVRFRPLRPLAGAFVVSILMACAGRGSAPPTADLAHSLVGVWCNSNDGGQTCWAYDEFTASGHFSACGRAEDDRLGFAGSGRFSVSGHRMCYVVETATANFWIQPGSRYCTDILSIGATNHRYRDIDSNQEFELLRVSPSRKLCPATR